MKKRKKTIPGPVGFIDGIPVFHVQRAGATLWFDCPECGVRHWHGGGEHAGAGDGHRCAHCDCWPAGYYLREARP